MFSNMTYDTLASQVSTVTSESISIIGSRVLTELRSSKTMSTLEMYIYLEN